MPWRSGVSTDLRVILHLHLLDGRAPYGEADVERLPLPDALRPDGATPRQMGERFAARAFVGDGALVERRP